MGCWTASGKPAGRGAVSCERERSARAHLPLYSDSMGYDVQYTVYLNGQKVRIYEYAIRRRVFMWLPVLPFAWVNLFTNDETDAFAAITQRFFTEASRDGAFDGRGTLPSAPAPVSSPQAKSRAP